MHSIEETRIGADIKQDQRSDDAAPEASVASTTTLGPSVSTGRALSSTGAPDGVGRLSLTWKSAVKGANSDDLAARTRLGLQIDR